MIRTSVLVAVLLTLCTMACARSQPVTGTIIRSGQAQSPAPAVKPSTQSTAGPGSPAQPNLPSQNIDVSEQTTKLQVGNEVYEFRRRVHEIHGKKGLQDSTVEWWELHDPAGKAVVHVDYGPPKLSQVGDFEETEDVTAKTFHADGGDGILVEGYGLPSAPRGGGWVQLFARPWGPTQQPLQAFGPPISTDGEFNGIDVDHRHDPPKPTRPGVIVIPMHDVMKFTIWTGNFDIEYLTLINWTTGRIQPGMRCLRTTMKGQVERCPYPIHVEAHRNAKDMTFVRMFAEPEEGFGSAEHVVIKPESKIEYLTAEVPVTWQANAKNVYISAESNDGEMWLKVRIDGKEGWIHTEEDLQAVGLPQSG